METKPFYLSKTFWLNLCGIVVLIIQQYTGYLISPELQTSILMILNLVLRATTGQIIDFGGKTFAK